MKYKYQGVTRARETVFGLIEANSAEEAGLKLRAQQIRPITVAEDVPGLFNGLSNIKWQKIAQGGKPKLKDMVIFTRQFSSLIDSGVAVVQCLDILHQQEKKKYFKGVLGKVKEDIESGAGLADALGKHRDIFSEFFIRIVEAGEISGTLDKALRRVGVQLEKLGRIRSKVIGAMIYPCVTVVVAVVVLVFLLVKVIPEVAKLYSDGHAQLPEITQIVLALSQWVQVNYLVLIGGAVGLFFGVPILYKIPAFRQAFDPFVLRVPGFGPLIKKSAIGNFTRTLSTLMASGVPLLKAFEICEKLIGNLAIKKVIRTANQSVTEGKGIAEGLKSNDLFPPMVLHMVAIGEMTGRLDELLGKVADIFDEELDDAVGVITGMIQPMMIVVVGAMVAFLLLAMYLPIFSLAEKATGG